MRKVLFISILLSSCISPDKWSESSHSDLIHECKLACSKTGMASYESLEAKCTCNTRNK